MSSFPGDAPSSPHDAPAGAAAGHGTEAEVVVVSGPGAELETEPMADDRPTETVGEPGKVMRIGSMIKQLLEEVRQAPLDERSRVRLREIYETSVKELSTALSPDLRSELASLALPFDDLEVPSEAELRVAQAQLVGWLEGLFHGIQATLFAQQMAAQAQLQQMRQIGPGGPGGPGGPQHNQTEGPGPQTRPGTYL